MPEWYEPLWYFCDHYPESALIVPAVIFALLFLTRLSAAERFLYAFTFPVALAYSLIFGLPAPRSNFVAPLMAVVFLAPQIAAVLVTGMLFVMSRFAKPDKTRDLKLVWFTTVSLIAGHLWTRLLLYAIWYG